MPCPYAKEIRGTTAYCTLLKKKVSTLRFPCKGNYKRCPVYIRYGGRARVAPAPRREEKTRPAPKQTLPQPTTPPAPQQAQTPVTTQTPPQPASLPAPSPAGANIVPSEALCDSLILAALLTSGRAVETYRGPLRGLLDYLNKKVPSDKLIFVIGPVGEHSFRGLYFNGKLSFAFEKSGTPVCGAEAERVLKEHGDDSIDAIIYEVAWEMIPLWKDLIMKELQ